MNKGKFLKVFLQARANFIKVCSSLKQDIGQIVEEKFNTAAPITLLNCKKVKGYLLHHLAKPIFLFVNSSRVALHD